MSTINERIKELRLSLGMTQTEFGKTIGVKIGVIKNFEYGITTPSDEQIELVSARMHVSTEWLKNGTGSMFRKVNAREKVAAFIGEALNDKTKTGVLYLLSLMDNEHWESLYKTMLSLAAIETDSTHRAPDGYMMMLEQCTDLLNSDGRAEALKRVQELTMIRKYTKPDGGQEE